MRSRALSLRLPQDAAAHSSTDGSEAGSGSGLMQQLDLCMVPLVDLANHRSGSGASCMVRLRVRGGGNRWAMCGVLQVTAKCSDSFAVGQVPSKR